MSDTTDTASDVKQQPPSDTELHDDSSLVESDESSSSSEPLIESHKRSKRPSSAASDTEQGADRAKAKRVKVSTDPPWWFQYIDELNATIHALTPSELSRKAFKQELQIGASLWTPKERDALYQALAKCSKDDTRQLSIRVGTKSALEVEVFLKILQRGVNEIAIFNPIQFLRLHEIPAAFEIGPDLERGLEQTADVIARLQDDREGRQSLKIHGDLWLLDRYALATIDSDEFEINDFIAASNPIAHDASAALELFDLRNFLSLSRKVFMNSCDPQQNYTTFAEDTEEPSLRLTAAVDFYRIVKALVGQMIGAAHHCALTRIREERDELEPEILENDIFAALEILRQSNRHLRDKGTEHKIGILRRNNVQPVATLDPNKRSRPISIDSAEWWLRRRLHPPPESQRANDGNVARADLEKACANDMKEENQLERLKARSIEEFFNDHEHYVTDLSGSSGTMTELDRRLDEDFDQDTSLRDDLGAEKDEAYAAKLDAIMDVEEVERLWKFCEDDKSGEISSDDGLITQKPKPPVRNFRKVQRDWRETLDYKPEWEQYREPIALQILERTIPKDPTPLASSDAPIAPDAASSAQPQASAGDVEAPPEASSMQPEVNDMEAGTNEEHVDTHMEEMQKVQSSDTTRSASSSTESSSEVSTSSEE